MTSRAATAATVAACLRDPADSPNRAALAARGGPSQQRFGAHEQANSPALTRVLAPPTALEEALLEAVQNRRAAAVRQFGDSDGTPDAAPVGTVRSKVLPGTGVTSSFFDTGLLLHPIYGWPYLPGHAIKGVVRAWIAECRTFDDQPQPQPAGLDRWQHLLGTDTVGTADGEPEPNGQDDTSEQNDDDRDHGSPGTATFFDAHPRPHRPSFKVGIDLINPHATLYADPVPVTFLSIVAASFTLHLLEWSDGVPGPLPTDEVTTVFEALDTVGIGAKTGSGFGYLHRTDREP